MNNNIKPTLVTQLVDIIKKIDQLKKEEEEVRKKLLELMRDNEMVQSNGYTVTKKVVKETITDPQMLQKLGFDLNRITVTITKVDPKLVREIGEKEGKLYYNETSRIIVSKVEPGVK